MKASVITLVLSDNYGAALQSSAFAHAVKQCCAEPTFYRYQDWSRMTYGMSTAAHIKHFAFNCIKACLTQGVRQKRFDAFRERYIPMTKRLYGNNAELRQEPGDYDVYISGSDQIPAVSFFRFCAELLEKYKDDLRVERITGVNLCGTWEDTPDDYFFARVPASSGTAMWRRSYEARDLELSYAKNPYVMERIKRDLPWYLKKQFVSFAETGTYANHKPGGEFFARHAEYLNHQLIIVPKYNQLNNIGVGAGSTHTGSNMKAMPKGLQKQYGMKTHEYQFPLKHPAFVFPDTRFEKEREKHLGVASRGQALWRTIERTFRLLFTGDAKKILGGLKKRLFKTVER